MVLLKMKLNWAASYHGNFGGSKACGSQETSVSGSVENVCIFFKFCFIKTYAFSTLQILLGAHFEFFQIFRTGFGLNDILRNGKLKIKSEISFING